MAWTEAEALASLRIRLADGAADKYLHQMPVEPPPDGIHREFGVPHSRLVADTLDVYLDGELLDILPGDIDLSRGVFTIPAPDEGQKLVASYYFQWFTDAELLSCLADAAKLLNFTGVTDTSMEVSFQTPLLSFAAHYAYLRKAAESAVPTVASSAGFAADTSKEHPYWMDLAKLAWDTAKEELETVNENPVSAARPAMRFVAYRLQRYVPRS